MTTSPTLPTLTIGGDLPITQLGLGTIQFTGDPDRWGPPADIDQATEVLRTAVDIVPLTFYECGADDE